MVPDIHIPGQLPGFSRSPQILDYSRLRCGRPWKRVRLRDLTVQKRTGSDDFPEPTGQLTRKVGFVHLAAGRAARGYEFRYAGRKSGCGKCQRIVTVSKCVSKAVCAQGKDRNARSWFV